MESWTLCSVWLYRNRQGHAYCDWSLGQRVVYSGLRGFTNIYKRVWRYLNKPLTLRQTLKNHRVPLLNWIAEWSHFVLPKQLAILFLTVGKVLTQLAWLVMHSSYLKHPREGWEMGVAKYQLRRRNSMPTSIQPVYTTVSTCIHMQT